MTVVTRSQTKTQKNKEFQDQVRRAKQTKRARKELQEFYEKNPPDLTKEERGNKDLYMLSKNKQFFKDIYDCSI